jgi:UTP--glucose-1-phosphate uridylyltransferase
MKIRKAVFPVAGMGTRLLPASKVVPKELLPIIDRPLLQFAIDEAVEAGCDTLIFIINRHKHAIADHLDRSFELEDRLTRTGKHELLRAVREVMPKHVKRAFVTQSEALGLGHAVLCARPAVGDEPFAVILPDDLIWNAGRGALGQMVDVAERTGGSVIAVEDVPREHTSRYGICSAQTIDERLGRIDAIVEKPKPEEAPSTLGVVGRYVLDGRIMDILEHTKPGAGGEIQLTDAIAELLRNDPVFAYRFAGRRFDCGNRAGVVQATLHFALLDPELAPLVRAAAAS